MDTVSLNGWNWGEETWLPEIQYFAAPSEVLESVFETMLL